MVVKIPIKLRTTASLQNVIAYSGTSFSQSVTTGSINMYSGTTIRGTSRRHTENSRVSISCIDLKFFWEYSLMTCGLNGIVTFWANSPIEELACVAIPDAALSATPKKLLIRIVIPCCLIATAPLPYSSHPEKPSIGKRSFLSFII